MPALSKKACLLGDFAVGKTSLVRRFVYNLFEDKYLSTIGVNVSRKTLVAPAVSADSLVDLTLMLWDLAGSAEFDQMRASYLRGAAGAVLVCDLTRATTLDGLRAYARDLAGVSPGAKLVLVGNKRDLWEKAADSASYLSLEELEALAAELGAPLCLTSAKTGDGVEEAFRLLGRLLVS